MSNAGRPSKFNKSLQEQMLKLYEEGRTDAQVANIVGVSTRTLHAWKGKHPDFMVALKKAKQIADDLVEASLFNRAVGYSHPEEKVFCHDGKVTVHRTMKHYPPDTVAAIFWLKNRQPAQWREKMPGEENKFVVNNIAGKSDEEIDARIKELLSAGHPVTKEEE